MSKSNKPIVWGLFAGGGTLTAFLTPVLVLVTLMAALGHVPDGLDYRAMHDFAANWFGKLVLLVVIVLSLWHAAHRFRITVHDFGVRADGLVAKGVYLLAAAGTIGAVIYLLSV